jgi:hypothetical protein
MGYTHLSKMEVNRDVLILIVKYFIRVWTLRGPMKIKIVAEVGVRMFIELQNKSAYS